MKNIQKAVIALTIFEVARLRLGHETASPIPVKGIVAEDRDDLLLQYTKIVRDAYSEEDQEGEFPPPVPVVDILSGVVSYTTCTKNTTISVSIPPSEEYGSGVNLTYAYNGVETRSETVVKELMNMSFDWNEQKPLNAAVLFVLVNNIFSTEEVEQYADLFGELHLLWLTDAWAKRIVGKWVTRHGDWVLLGTEKGEEYSLIQLYPPSEDDESFSPLVRGYTREEVERMVPINLFWFGENREEIISKIVDPWTIV